MKSSYLLLLISRCCQNKSWANFGVISLTCLISACGGSGGQSAPKQDVGSDVAIRSQLFSDLPVKGIDLYINGTKSNQIEYPVPSNTKVQLYLRGLALTSELSLKNTLEQPLKFRDLFLSELPETPTELKRETGTLSNVTGFDKLTNALVLLASLDDDSSLINGIDLSTVNFAQLDASDLDALELPDLNQPLSNFMSSPQAQRWIYALGGSFAIDPYIVIAEYYQRNQISMASEQIIKVNTEIGDTIATINYDYNTDGNIEEIVHAIIDQSGGSTTSANENLQWENSAQLSTLTATTDSATVSIAYDYDAFGRLESETRNLPDESLLISYRYDTDGTLREIQSINTLSGFTLTSTESYEYIDNKLSKTTYEVNNSAFTSAQRSSKTFFYDSQGLLFREDFDRNLNGVVDSQTYISRDSDQNVIEKRVEVRGEVSALERFTYNNLGQEVSYERDLNGDNIVELNSIKTYNVDDFLAEWEIRSFDSQGELNATEVRKLSYLSTTRTSDIRNLIAPPQVRVPQVYQP